MFANKKPIITLLCINAILTIILILSSMQPQPVQTKVEIIEDPLAKVKNDTVLAMLQNSIELACKGHYKKSGDASVIIEPYMIEILEMKRSGSDNSYNFTVKVKVTPYSGAHQMGEDHLTLHISKHNVSLLEYTHLKDLPAPGSAQQMQP